MEYFVADSYKGAKRVGTPYKNDKGNLMTRIKYVCPRCSGKGIIVARVENNRLIPIPVDGGICYQCGGAKYITKEVRLYTEKEYNTLQKNKIRQQERKQEENEKRREAEYASNKEKWVKQNNFSNNEKIETYIYFKEDSYAVKDELKAAGFTYDPILKWHKNTNEGYADSTFKVEFNEIGEFDAWGRGHYKAETADFLAKKINEARGIKETKFFSTIGEKIKDKKVTITSKHSFEGRFGITNVFSFVDEQGYNFSWFTSTLPAFGIGEVVLLSGTIKDFNEYTGIKYTVLTRCKMKGVE